jgi:phosphoribosylaminoimidazolecarboxamide formyltransferase / IMP cyclohydrolase
MLDGRVKTLHPKVHGGILARRDLPEHMAPSPQHGIPRSTSSVVNLYPFAQPSPSRAARWKTPSRTSTSAARPWSARRPRTTATASAASSSPTRKTTPRSRGNEGQRRRADATPPASPGQEGLHPHRPLRRRDRQLADRALDAEDGSKQRPFPTALQLAFDKVQTCATARTRTSRRPSTATRIRPGGHRRLRQLQGKELSYNNIADADAAWECVKAFDGPACVIVKHANPCGVASAPAARRLPQGLLHRPDLGLRRHHRLQPRSRRRATPKPSPAVRRSLIAPVLHAEASPCWPPSRTCACWSCRSARRHHALDFKRVGGGLLVQTPTRLHRVGQRPQGGHQAHPTEQEMRDLLFAWRVGQVRQVQRHRLLRRRHDRRRRRRPDEPRRLGAHRRDQGRERRLALPARWSPRTPSSRSATASTCSPSRRHRGHPAGGSMRDEEVIAAADEHGIAMVFTGARHFRH